MIMKNFHAELSFFCKNAKLKLLLGACAVSFGVPALAQTANAAATAASARTDETDTILVSARRRDESLQDVPLSVTVFDAEFIQRAGVMGFNDIARLTPSLILDRDFGGQDLRPTIRGLPATRGRPPVGILLNGVDITSEAVATAGGGLLLNMQMLDLERVEVVKGPQSALYGRSAFAGAVNYVTKRPGDSFEGKFIGQVAAYGEYMVGAAIGGPVAEGVRIRFNGNYNRGDGYYRNDVSGDRVGGYRNYQLGTAIDLDFTEKFTAQADYIYTDGQQGQPAYYQYSLIDNSASPFPLPANVAGTTNGNLTLRSSISSLPRGEMQGREKVELSLNPRTGEDYPGSYVRTHFGTLMLNYDFGGAQLTSRTGYLNARTGVFQDIDGFGRAWTNVSLPAPGGVNEPLPFNFEFRVDTKTTQFSQNIQLANLEGNGFRWAVGGLYWYENVRQDNGTLATILTAPGASAGLNTLLGNNPAFVSRDDGRKTTHWSGYALAEVDVTDKLILGFEARYATESYVYDFTTSQLILTTGLVPVSSVGGARGQRGIPYSEDTFAPKFYAQYQFNEDVMGYASAGKGIKPGGISTVGVFNSVADNGYRAETLWNYEIGLKSSLFDRRLLFNIAAFWMDYTDKQVSVLVVDPSQPSGLRGVTQNAGAGRVKGLELDTRFNFTRELSLNAAYTYLDAVYTDYTLLTRTPHIIAYANQCEITTVGTGSQSTQCFVDLSGNRIERAPRHAASATLAYNTKVSEKISVLGEFALQYQSERFFEDLNAHTFGEFIMADVRLTVSGDRWSVTAYIDNLFNDRTIKSGFTQGDFSALFSSPGSRSFVLYAPDPRRGGVRFTTRF
jgi:outer membrane receptor protein involved in Fe transport